MTFGERMEQIYKAWRLDKEDLTEDEIVRLLYLAKHFALIWTLATGPNREHMLEGLLKGSHSEPAMEEPLRWLVSITDDKDLREKVLHAMADKVVDAASRLEIKPGSVMHSRLEQQ